MPSSYTVGDHFERFVQEMLKSGRYSSASEVIRYGLRLMEEREQARSARLEALRTDIRAGLDSGPAEPLDMAEIMAAARGQRTRKTNAVQGE